MAKPNPSANSSFILVTPTTSPRKLNKGPPLFPGLISAVSLDEGDAAHVPVAGADNSLRDRAFETQRISDGKHLVSLALVVFACQKHLLEFDVFLDGDLQQCQVEEGVQGHDGHVRVDSPTDELADGILMKDGDGNPRFLFDDVIVRHAMPALVENEPRSQAAGGLHQHDPFPEFSPPAP